MIKGRFGQMIALTTTAALLSASGAFAQNEAAIAAQILATPGVRGGVCAHVGCGNGALTVEFGSYPGLVQGITDVGTELGTARALVQSRGLYGSMSVVGTALGRLPYAENLVNLIVIDSPRTNVSRREILRVLVPNGVAIIDGKKIVKPIPANIDEWSHFEHGPENNSVATTRQRPGASLWATRTCT